MTPVCNEWDDLEGDSLLRTNALLAFMAKKYKSLWVAFWAVTRWFNNCLRALNPRWKYFELNLSLLITILGNLLNLSRPVSTSENRNNDTNFLEPVNEYKYREDWHVVNSLYVEILLLILPLFILSLFFLLDEVTTNSVAFHEYSPLWESWSFLNYLYFLWKE